ncbi:MAG: CopG family ribbon-helix-helix protein [Gammaproteobacteria bacterium]
MISKAVKLDDSTVERLKALGEIRRRSPHWLMKEAIRQFLDRE